MKALISNHDIKMLNSMREYLEAEGIQVVICNSYLEAIQYINRTDMDLLILDTEYPAVKGIDLCKKFRAVSNYTPIILTSCLSDEKLMKYGLEHGADDFLLLPKNIKALAMRAKVLMRRYRLYSETHLKGAYNEISCNGLTINTDTHECYIANLPIILTNTEFIILRSLLQKCDEIVTNEEIFRALWMKENYIKNNTISVHVNHIRNKLGSKSKGIETIWGIGYRFNTKV